MFFYPLGSKLLFAALLDRCKARNVAAICSLKTTASTTPQQVALLPLLDPNQQTLSGFHVIDLPFLNDVRILPYQELVKSEGEGEQDRKIVRAERDKIEAAKAIVKRLKVSIDRLI